MRNLSKLFQLSAIFMSLLVLTLPAVFAQQLSVSKFSGSQNVEGIVGSSDDTLYISVTAELSGSPSEDVAAERLLVRHGGIEDYFSSCTKKETDLYDCVYESTDLISFGSEDYEIVLLDAEDNEIKSVEKILFVDKAVPEILKFSVEPRLSRTGDMKIIYFVEDYGKRSGESAGCSGIEEIIITAGGSNIKTIDFDEPGVCDSDEKTFDYKYDSSNNFVDLDICISAKDYLGRESSVECESFSIDNAAPNIKSVDFKDLNGYEISHIKTGKKYSADMFIEIVDGGGVDLDSVWADFSKLSPDSRPRKPDYSNGNFYVWQNVLITNPGDCEVKVKANDEIGNEAEKTLTCTLPVDDVGPVPGVIYAGASDSNGTPLVGVNGTVFVDFQEDGSGMDKANAYLDLHNLGLGSVVKADSCFENSQGGWTCEWSVVPKVKTGMYKIIVLDASADDLGNNAVQESGQIVVDSTPPEISSVDITFIHENADFGPRAVYGDTIEFLFNVSGASEGFANLSMVGGNYSSASECTEDYCKFVVLIDVSGPLNASIDFDFYDIALNHEEYSYNFQIYGVMSNATEADYWKSSVICSPRMIDRHTAELYNHPVYCQVKLRSSNPDAEVVYASPGDLSACTGDLGGYVVDMDVINNNFGSTNPYVVFTLAAAPFQVNDLKFECPLFVATRVGDYFSPVVEIENVSVRLEFYNLPYGEVYSNTEKEIKHSMEKALNTMEWVGTVEEYLDMFRKICNTKNAFTSVLSAIEAAIDLLYVAALGVAVLFGASDSSLKKELIFQAQFLCENAAGPLERLTTGSVKKEDESDSVVGDVLNYQKEQKKKSLSLDDPVGLWNLLDLACKAANCQLSREEAKQYEGELAVYGSHIFGGGLGQEDTCRYFKGLVGGQLESLTKDYEAGPGESPVDVKESMVGSVACTCLPGITYNLNKIRQIYCGYAYCLGKRVLEEGLPRSYCSSEKAYLTCNYVVGQVFEATPFVNVVDRYASIIQEAYANPISTITALSALACGGNEGKGGFYDYCMPRETFEMDAANMGLYLLCSVPKTAAKIGDAVASYQLSEQEWTGKVQNNYCEEAEDLLK